MKKRKKGLLVFIFIGLFIVAIICVLYYFNYIPHKQYTNEDLGISEYKSDHDEDEDGIDDQRDILESAREYLATEPRYKSKYYTTGYPNDGCGVCTDVVAFAMLGAGYDLMELVNEDIKKYPERYAIDEADINIDFRRVVNLKVYFDNNAIAMTTEVDDIDEWQGGDIVVFEGHIAVVSDKRNKNGVPFILHNANPFQRSYEEDLLEYRYNITGHYRIS